MNFSCIVARPGFVRNAAGMIARAINRFPFFMVCDINRRHLNRDPVRLYREHTLCIKRNPGQEGMT